VREETRQRTEDPATSRNCGTTARQAKAASGLASGWEREALASSLDGQLAGSGPGRSTEGEGQQMEKFFRQYTSHGEILKYTKATAGFGINYLLEHDYKTVYLNALNFLPQQTREGGIRILEFGCGGGMNLLHLISVLNSEGIRVANALGTDFSPAMIETARREAKNYLREQDLQSLQNLEFHVAKNESLISDLSGSRATEESTLKNSFHFILGVNTIRYCHDAKRQRDCVRNIFNLLVPGGVCVVIDMNNRFPFFRSDLKNRVRRQKEKQCYVPSLEEYTEPFVQGGFEVLRSEHFCWVPHSASGFMTRLLSWMSPVLNKVARSRAMRSLVVSRKPATVT
jgi:SAM-dependent methyltransferase